MSEFEPIGPADGHATIKRRLAEWAKALGGRPECYIAMTTTFLEQVRVAHTLLLEESAPPEARVLPDTLLATDAAIREALSQIQKMLSYTPEEVICSHPFGDGALSINMRRSKILSAEYRVGSHAVQFFMAMRRLGDAGHAENPFTVVVDQNWAEMIQTLAKVKTRVPESGDTTTAAEVVDRLLRFYRGVLRTRIPDEVQLRQRMIAVVERGGTILH